MVKAGTRSETEGTNTDSEREGKSEEMKTKSKSTRRYEVRCDQSVETEAQL